MCACVPFELLTFLTKFIFCNQRPLLLKPCSSMPTHSTLSSFSFSSAPSVEEGSGGDRVLPLAPEERGLSVGPVLCHRLHQPQSPPRTQRHLGQLRHQVSPVATVASGQPQRTAHPALCSQTKSPTPSVHRHFNILNCNDDVCISFYHYVGLCSFTTPKRYKYSHKEIQYFPLSLSQDPQPPSL